MYIYFNNKFLLDTNGEDLFTQIQQKLNLSVGTYYLLNNGKLLKQNEKLQGTAPVHIIPRLVGGKGGFGSMLRAIGAQIEKTTNREACRDLSGRRLRDINEEQRLKNWIAAQAEREKEAAEKKQKKLERMCQEPKHEFRDAEYDKQRSALPEKVEDAVIQGMQASCSSTKVEAKKRKKKPKLWIDDEISDTDDSEDNEESDSEPTKKKKKSSTDNKEMSETGQKGQSEEERETKEVLVK